MVKRNEMPIRNGQFVKKINWGGRMKSDGFFLGLFCGLILGLCVVFIIYVFYCKEITFYKEKTAEYKVMVEEYKNKETLSQRIDSLELLIRDFMFVEEINPEDLTNPIPEWRNPKK